MCDILPHFFLYDNHTKEEIGKKEERPFRMGDETDVLFKSEAFNAAVNQLGDVSVSRRLCRKLL